MKKMKIRKIRLMSVHLSQKMKNNRILKIQMAMKKKKKKN
jgi:hypothetical protein